MILSRDRILTTHVGSLPRNEGLSELLVQREAGEAYDKVLFGAEMEKAIRHGVAKQKAAGIDSGNDGEQQRVGFQTYIPQRMSGFGGESKRRRGPGVKLCRERVAEEVAKHADTPAGEHWKLVLSVIDSANGPPQN